MLQRPFLLAFLKGRFLPLCVSIQTGIRATLLFMQHVTGNSLASWKEGSRRRRTPLNRHKTFQIIVKCRNRTIFRFIIVVLVPSQIYVFGNKSNFSPPSFPFQPFFLIFSPTTTTFERGPYTCISPSSMQPDMTNESCCRKQKGFHTEASCKADFCHLSVRNEGKSVLATQK